MCGLSREGQVSQPKLVSNITLTTWSKLCAPSLPVTINLHSTSRSHHVVTMPVSCLLRVLDLGLQIALCSQRSRSAHQGVMLPAESGTTSEGRTAMDNMTVRTVYVIGPDKKIKLMISYPMTTGPQLRRGAARAGLAAADGEAPRGDAGELEAGRRRDHRRVGVRRRGEEDLPERVEEP